MAKKDRIDRSIGDKRAMLREQILLLTSYADSYDAGKRAFAKPMGYAFDWFDAYIKLALI